MLAGRLFPLSPPAFANGFFQTGIGEISHLPRALIQCYQNWVITDISWRAGFLAPEQGAIASAILVGERDYVEDDVYDDFRKAGLAHLLAISGLHMGIFCFSIFSVIRFGCALVPHYDAGFSA